jgi:hypothetical protein
VGVVGDLVLSFPISSQSAARSESFPFRNKSDNDGLFFAFELSCRESAEGSALYDGDGEFCEKILALSHFFTPSRFIGNFRLMDPVVLGGDGADVL